MTRAPARPREVEVALREPAKLYGERRSLQQAFERRQLADWVADPGLETRQIKDLKQKAPAFLDFPRGFLTS